MSHADPSIRFTYDYVDPGSYLTYELLRRWIDDAGAEIEIGWIPLELRKPGESRIRSDAPDWDTLHAAMRTLADREGIVLRGPSEAPWTRKAHELGLHAREKGCFEGVHRALFEAHFVDSADIGRVDVLVEIGRGAGLDPAETRTVLGIDRHSEEVEELRREALARGIRGVPTLEAGDERLEGLKQVSTLRVFLDGVLSAIDEVDRIE